MQFSPHTFNATSKSLMARTEIFYTILIYPRGQLWAESPQSLRPFSGSWEIFISPGNCSDCVFHHIFGHLSRRQNLFWPILQKSPGFGQTSSPGWCKIQSLAEKMEEDEIDKKVF